MNPRLVYQKEWTFLFFLIDVDLAAGPDPELAATMGFSGFGE